MIQYFGRVMLYSLLLTELSELAVSLLWGIRGRNLLYVAEVNLLTNPVYVYLVLRLKIRMHPDRLTVVRIVMECLIVLAEGLWYARKLDRERHPWLLSLTANLASIATGIWLSRS